MSADIEGRMHVVSYEARFEIGDGSRYERLESSTLALARQAVWRLCDTCIYREVIISKLRSTRDARGRRTIWRKEIEGYWVNRQCGPLSGPYHPMRWPKKDDNNTRG